jgi:hypothetical protein
MADFASSANDSATTSSVHREREGSARFAVRLDGLGQALGGVRESCAREADLLDSPNVAVAHRNNT